ncbi:helicase PIF1-like [Carpediemonas membranifera]|uniref:ATP-dependent DNA helicase n=1 Tax=Carpediemonas membranifera TaxID=201153 RepID=A0A8J6DYP4_9EUKA|nr:helicase PIF1-like [Carpediemonas membranifera]|eukprot:KAG9392559.1 helicase PIF1-like [Carpediemonas membranifera]
MMLSRADISDISDTLRQIRGGELPFGGVNMIFVGDPNQLPPVPKKHEAVLSALHYHWEQHNTAKLFELQSSFRQQADPAFTAILDGIASTKINTKKIEPLYKRAVPDTPESLKLMIKLMLEGHTMITARRDRAHSLNRIVVNTLAKSDGCPVTQLVSYVAWAKVIDGVPGFSRFSCGTANVHSELEDTSAKRDYHDRLERIDFCVGCRVILTWNVITELGLVNGAKATILSINQSDPSVEVQMADSGQVHIIREMSVKQGIFTHTFIPLMPAYVLTIHKAQGQTIPRLIVDLRENMNPKQDRRSNDFWEVGQLYTALSRAPTLDALTIFGGVDTHDKMTVNGFTFNTVKPVPELFRPIHTKVVTSRVDFLHRKMLPLTDMIVRHTTREAFIDNSGVSVDDNTNEVVRKMLKVKDWIRFANAATMYAKRSTTRGPALPRKRLIPVAPKLKKTKRKQTKRNPRKPGAKSKPRVRHIDTAFSDAELESDVELEALTDYECEDNVAAIGFEHLNATYRSLHELNLTRVQRSLVQRFRRDNFYRIEKQNEVHELAAAGIISAEETTAIDQWVQEASSKDPGTVISIISNDTDAAKELLDTAEAEDANEAIQTILSRIEEARRAQEHPPAAHKPAQPKTTTKRKDKRKHKRKNKPTIVFDMGSPESPPTPDYSKGDATYALTVQHRRKSRERTEPPTPTIPVVEPPTQPEDEMASKCPLLNPRKITTRDYSNARLYDNDGGGDCAIFALAMRTKAFYDFFMSLGTGDDVDGRVKVFRQRFRQYCCDYRDPHSLIFLGFAPERAHTITLEGTFLNIPTVWAFYCHECGIKNDSLILYKNQNTIEYTIRPADDDPDRRVPKCQDVINPDKAILATGIRYNDGIHFMCVFPEDGIERQLEYVDYSAATRESALNPIEISDDDEPPQRPLHPHQRIAMRRPPQAKPVPAPQPASPIVHDIESISISSPSASPSSQGYVPPKRLRTTPPRRILPKRSTRAAPSPLRESAPAPARKLGRPRSTKFIIYSDSEDDDEHPKKPKGCITPKKEGRTCFNRKNY